MSRVNIGVGGNSPMNTKNYTNLKNAVKAYANARRSAKYPSMVSSSSMKAALNKAINDFNGKTNRGSGMKVPNLGLRKIPGILRNAGTSFMSQAKASRNAAMRNLRALKSKIQTPQVKAEINKNQKVLTRSEALLQQASQEPVISASNQTKLASLGLNNTQINKINNQSLINKYKRMVSNSTTLNNTTKQTIISKLNARSQRLKNINNEPTGPRPQIPSFRRNNASRASFPNANSNRLNSQLASIKKVTGNNININKTIMNNKNLRSETKNALIAKLGVRN